MVRNVFVPGLTDMQRGELETLRGADDYRFHGLLDLDRLVDPDEYDFEGLLAQAREQLDAFDGSIDAIIAHWDFPTSVLAPLLAAEHGIPSPSLDSVLACEHKLWSRLEQAASVPECVPPFAPFDPFDDDALDGIDLAYPFWVKPVKSFASQLSFRIDDADDFHRAIPEIRAEIGRIGHAFDAALDRVELPEAVRSWTGTACIAEGIISGVQAAPEGAMSGGEFLVHGTFDMLKGEEGGSTFDRLDYPSRLPDDVQQRMIDVTERYLRHIGFDDGCFNAEFMWDRDQDQLWLVEINTRISQSHSDLFAKVDGASNHEIAIDVALGERPRIPHGEGRFAVAAQCHILHEDDAVVVSVPSDDDIARLVERFPETIVEISVEPGDRLAQLPNQSNDRYDLGAIYLGAGDWDELEERYAACLDGLPFAFEPVDGV